MSRDHYHHLWQREKELPPPLLERKGEKRKKERGCDARSGHYNASVVFEKEGIKVSSESNRCGEGGKGRKGCLEYVYPFR